MTDDPGPKITVTWLVRNVFGGVLMGLANLVPGISGGTMLLAAGVYPQFIGGVAEVTTFRFRMPTILLLACVVGGALVALVALAGPVKHLVLDHRWVMYSLFIGLTLGGAPLLWRMLHPLTPAAWIGAGGGLLAMVALVCLQETGAAQAAGGGGQALFMLLLAGVAGGSAMILPGVSGAYLLLVLGQYIVILDAIDSARAVVSDRAWSELGEPMGVFVPVGIGVVVGVVGVSNVIKVLLARCEKATLGVLLGLLLGAVFGIWPFQESMPPEVGDVVRGVELASQAMVEEVEPKYWATAFFTPGLLQIAASAGLIAAGFAASTLIARLGRTSNEA